MADPFMDPIDAPQDFDELLQQGDYNLDNPEDLELFPEVNDQEHGLPERIVSPAALPVFSPQVADESHRSPPQERPPDLQNDVEGQQQGEANPAATIYHVQVIRPIYLMPGNHILNIRRQSSVSTRFAGSAQPPRYGAQSIQITASPGATVVVVPPRRPRQIRINGAEVISLPISSLISAEPEANEDGAME